MNREVSSQVEKEEGSSSFHYCTAAEAARILSERLGRPIPVNYMHKLAYRKKHPVRTWTMGDRLLYHRDDISNVEIRKGMKK